MGQDSIAKTEASAHALHIAQKMVRATFEKDKWDILLHAVTEDLDPMVGLKEFIQTCKRIARCGRLLQFVEFEMQEELPLLTGKNLQHWKAVAEDVSRRLGQRVHRGGPSDESDFLRALEASRQDAGAPADGGGAATGADAPQCDLCKVTGACAYHAQQTAPRRRSGPGRGQRPGDEAPANAGFRSSSGELDAKTQARLSLQQAVFEVSQLAQRLEEAILTAADAGLNEEELLPAFARLEELHQMTAVSC